MALLEVDNKDVEGDDEKKGPSPLPFPSPTGLNLPSFTSYFNYRHPSLPAFSIVQEIARPVVGRSHGSLRPSMPCTPTALCSSVP